MFGSALNFLVFIFLGTAFITFVQHFLQACHSAVIFILLSTFSFNTFLIKSCLFSHKNFAFFKISSVAKTSHLSFSV